MGLACERRLLHAKIIHYQEKLMFIQLSKRKYKNYLVRSKNYLVRSKKYPLVKSENQEFYPQL